MSFTFLTKRNAIKQRAHIMSSSAQPLARRQSQRLLLSSEKKAKTKKYDANTTNGRKQTPSKPKREKLDLTGDRLNICLLLLLYTLQGVPMGLSSTVAFSLTEKGASFGDQGVFSLASWPFSLKILWAPMIDALYVKRIGQRRTWLIPLQLLVGGALFVLSGNLEGMIENGAKFGDAKPLAMTFFSIYFLLASQDVAVDGWAITMLKRENVGLASTCNAVGQTFGFFASFTGFLVLNARGYCELKGFVMFWSAMFFLSSLAVFLKREDMGRMEEIVGVKETYRQGIKVMSLRNVQSLALILLTRHVAFSPAESLTQLKLLEKGVPKTFLASMNAVIAPLNIMMPMISAKWTAGAKPLRVVLNTFVYRGIACAFASVVVVAWTKVLASDGAQGTAPVNYEKASSNVFFSGLVLAWMCVSSALSTVQFVGVMSFFSKVSDESIGGTYMTLLNTLSNLGSKIAETFVLFFVDFVSEKRCVGASSSSSSITACSTKQERDMCVSAGGKCHLDDGHYHTFVLVSPAVALAWVVWQRKRVQRLSASPLEEWRLSTSSRKDY